MKNLSKVPLIGFLLLAAFVWLNYQDVKFFFSRETRHKSILRASIDENRPNTRAKILSFTRQSKNGNEYEYSGEVELIGKGGVGEIKIFHLRVIENQKLFGGNSHQVTLLKPDKLIE